MEGVENVDDLNSVLTPGTRVTHPEKPEWGIGQVQSNIAGKVTVTFQHQGKQVLDSRRVTLDLIYD